MIVPVGARLAREGGVSVDNNVEFEAAFASKLRSYKFVTIQN
jgi:hypothetical protein